MSAPAGARAAGAGPADFDPVPAPPLLPDVPRVLPVYRVRGWQYVERPHDWHLQRSLHAHLGCSKVRAWAAGGYVREHARAGRRGPPDPPSVIVEHYVVTDLPQHLRCGFCWGPAKYGLSGPRWRPDWGEPWWPTPSGRHPHWYDEIGMHARAFLDRWCKDQFRALDFFWRAQLGGIYEPEVQPLVGGAA